jgi:hypothetical protein
MALLFRSLPALVSKASCLKRFNATDVSETSTLLSSEKLQLYGNC